MNITKTQLKQITYDSMVMEATHSGESEFTPLEITKLVYNALIELGTTPDEDVLYSYGYDVRWSLQQLRKEGRTSFRKEGKRSLHYLLPVN